MNEIVLTEATHAGKEVDLMQSTLLFSIAFVISAWPGSCAFQVFYSRPHDCLPGIEGLAADL